MASRSCCLSRRASRVGWHRVRCTRPDGNIGGGLDWGRVGCPSRGPIGAGAAAAGRLLWRMQPIWGIARQIGLRRRVQARNQGALSSSTVLCRSRRRRGGHQHPRPRPRPRSRTRTCLPTLSTAPAEHADARVLASGSNTGSGGCPKNRCAPYFGLQLIVHKHVARRAPARFAVSESRRDRSPADDRAKMFEIDLQRTRQRGGKRAKELTQRSQRNRKRFQAQVDKSSRYSDINQHPP